MPANTEIKFSLLKLKSPLGSYDLRSECAGETIIIAGFKTDETGESPNSDRPLSPTNCPSVSVNTLPTSWTRKRGLMMYTLLRPIEGGLRDGHAKCSSGPVYGSTLVLVETLLRCCITTADGPRTRLLSGGTAGVRAGSR